MCQRPPKRFLGTIIAYGSVASLHICRANDMDALSSPAAQAHPFAQRSFRYAHSLPLSKIGGKWGVWGEGSEAAGSPHSYSANIYGQRRP